jgi:excisionase family DNA binding protein
VNHIAGFPGARKDGQEGGGSALAVPLSLSQGELAEALNVHPVTLRRMVATGQLPVRAIDLGTRRRYSVRSVVRWLLEREPSDADLGADCRLLTTAETAKLLGCSRATAYRLLGVDEPLIRPTLVGSERRFPACRVNEFVDAATKVK